MQKQPGQVRKCAYGEYHDGDKGAGLRGVPVDMDSYGCLELPPR